ncbi:hypothetical protein [uncultured Sphingomonas sp.]|uniref:hypothetical protein n=1 Tax=uncultured Sphingomonas sp. TaxID=158754 RepID=UPI0035C99FAC
MSGKKRDWVCSEEAVRAAAVNSREAAITVGGRYISTSDAEEDAMVSVLGNAGLNLSDAGQCEIVASVAVPATKQSILEAIELHRRLASTHDYRLQAVEVGNVEDGSAAVIASEHGYIPWWQVEANGS